MKKKKRLADLMEEVKTTQIRIGAKLDHLIEWFEREPFVRLKREWEDREALLEH